VEKKDGAGAENFRKDGAGAQKNRPAPKHGYGTVPVTRCVRKFYIISAPWYFEYFLSDCFIILDTSMNESQGLFQCCIIPTVSRTLKSVLRLIDLQYIGKNSHNFASGANLN
jgi:hypothetical protein